ncbi:ABC transporter ATP-binding protein [Verrucomicrobia bacterium]|nr:ABC transporter ATP-binding protein [Verrucomicrobiota bacterium]NCG26215.1 dipeptide ABC transporter ATP-binding protein [Verrucomicrobiales bacterium]
MSNLLKIDGLETGFDTERGPIRAVDGISFELQKGKTLGVVGESGCGKTVTAMSIVDLLPKPSGKVLGGSISLNGKELTGVDQKVMQRVRGNEIGVIFQEPMAALNPVQRIGKQITEALVLHKNMNKGTALREAVQLLEAVGIPSPERRVIEYPHQLSGGMRQRVMIAIALCCEPDLLIADEPTTALDVTVQAQILNLISKMQDNIGMAVMLITHDLGVIAEQCDEVIVMYAGRIVERAPVRELFSNPLHAYTKGLLASIPRLESERKTVLPTIPGQVASIHEFVEGCRFCQRMQRSGELVQERPPYLEINPGHFVEQCPECTKEDSNIWKGPSKSVGQIIKLRRSEPFTVWVREIKAKASHKQMVTLLADRQKKLKRIKVPLLRVEELKMHFPVRGGIFSRQTGAVKAVDGVSISINAGETLGLVGESGCGKSTLGKSIVRLLRPNSGKITFKGEDITSMAQWSLRKRRQDFQMVFQDPAESLDARMSVGQLVSEPMIIQKMGNRNERNERVFELLDRVGLPRAAADKFPFEFSGGQRQRIGIARALAVNPDLLVLDEPVSALDVSVQSQVLNLLMELQRDLGLSYLFIAHDLAVVKHVSDRIAVMYLGKIVEMTDAEKIYRGPRHAYTKALIEAIPVTDPSRMREHEPLEGEVPSPMNPPEGCAFGHRINAPNYEQSKGKDIKLEEIESGHWVSNCPCCVDR